jgi:hypothetical protein
MAALSVPVVALVILRSSVTELVSELLVDPVKLVRLSVFPILTVVFLIPCFQFYNLLKKINNILIFFNLIFCNFHISDSQKYIRYRRKCHA